jgi:hypothetical protein
MINYFCSHSLWCGYKKKTLGSKVLKLNLLDSINQSHKSQCPKCSLVQETIQVEMWEEREKRIYIVDR